MRTTRRSLAGVGFIVAVVAGASALAAIPVHAATVTCSDVSVGTSLSDCGFEAPTVGTDFYAAFSYAPQGTAWSYSNGAGVAGNGSGFTFGNPPAPEGTQVGFIQVIGSASQSISGWRSGELYTLTMSVAQRVAGCAGGGCGPEGLQVQLDGQVIGTFTVSNGTYTDVSVAEFSTTAGTHTLTIQGVDPSLADDTAFIDAVRLTSSPSVPTTRSDCKDGGWQAHRSASDGAFKNQGDCVSYIATGGRNDELDRLALARGCPAVLRCDKGPALA